MLLLGQQSNPPMKNVSQITNQDQSETGAKLFSLVLLIYKKCTMYKHISVKASGHAFCDGTYLYN